VLYVCIVNNVKFRIDWKSLVHFSNNKGDDEHRPWFLNNSSVLLLLLFYCRLATDRKTQYGIFAISFVGWLMITMRRPWSPPYKSFLLPLVHTFRNTGWRSIYPSKFLTWFRSCHSTIFNKDCEYSFTTN